MIYGYKLKTQFCLHLWKQGPIIKNKKKEYKVVHLPLLYFKKLHMRIEIFTGAATTDMRFR